MFFAGHPFKLAGQCFSGAIIRGCSYYQDTGNLVTSLAGKYVLLSIVAAVGWSPVKVLLFEKSPKLRPKP